MLYFLIWVVDSLLCIKFTSILNKI
jgi:hypothetical protein